MAKLPSVTALDVMRALRRDGWEVVRQAGSHTTLKHATKRGSVVVPVHHGSIKPGTLRNIISQSGLTAAEFERLL